MKHLIIQTSPKKTDLNFRKKSEGFTLLELMIALAMIGILLAIIVPDMGVWKSKYTFKKNTRDTLAAVKYARSAAINMNIPVFFTVGSGGYSVTVDTDRNNILEATDRVLLNDTYTRNVTITNNSFVTDILFNQRGIPSNSGSFQLNLFQEGQLITLKTVTLFATGGATTDLVLVGP